MENISIERFLEIKNKHKKWLNHENGGERANFENIDLRSLILDPSFNIENLEGAVLVNAEFIGIRGNKESFKEMYLAGAKFTGADLSDSDFTGAHLRRAVFKGANLRGVNFSKANLMGVNFTGADISTTNFSQANLESARFVGGSLYNLCFHDANLSYSNFSGVNINEMDTTGALFTRTYFNFAYFHRSNLSNVNLESATIFNVTFFKTVLQKANLKNSLMANTIFDGVDLEQADLRNADLENVLLKGVNLSGANLENAYLANARLLNVNLNNAIMPDGKIYDPDVHRIEDITHEDIEVSEKRRLKQTRGRPPDWVINLDSCEDRKLIEKMICFIPIFNQEGYEYCNPQIPDRPDGSYIVQTGVSYKKEVENFLAIFTDEQLRQYDENKWFKENMNAVEGRSAYSPKWMEAASLDSLVKGFSFAFSSERFIDGFVEIILTNGTALGLLKQIKVIYDNYLKDFSASEIE